MENTKLREQFIRDMKLKGFAEGTQKAYLSCVILFVKKYNRNPQELGETEIKEYLFQLSEEGRSKTYINQCYSGLRFLYETTLKRDWESYKIPRSKQKKRLPVALSQQEIYTLITETKNLKHKAIFSVMYSGGLRVKETTSLKTDDIDSKQMRIYVSDGKGGKDRYTILSNTALKDLREYCKTYRITDSYLFKGRDSETPLSNRTVQSVFKQIKEKEGLDKRATVHSIRHSFATHMLESGVSIYHLQRLMGHTQVQTTSKYLHISNLSALQITSVQDKLFGSVKEL
ncbi:MAG: site-specific integrase [Vallitaleaceae bacterium]|nr:site-specific integrase [Vallitaleaceae bacterium]